MFFETSLLFNKLLDIGAFLLAAVLFLIILVLLYRRRHDILDTLSSIKKSTWILAAALLFIYLLVVSALIPPNHSMWLDESYYANGAKNMLLHGTYSDCFTVEHFELQCTSAKPNQAWGFLISITYLLFGINNYHAIYLTLFLTMVGAVVLLLIAKELFRTDRIAITAMILFLLIPIQIQQSRNAESNIAGQLFMMLAFLFVLFYRKHEHLEHLLISAGMLLLSMQARVEQILAIPAFLLFLFLTRKKSKKSNTTTSQHQLSNSAKILNICIILFLYVCFVFGAVPQLLASLHGRNAPGLYSIESMMTNLNVQLTRFPQEYLPVSFVFGVIGFLVLYLKKNRFAHALSLLLLFATFFFFWPSRVLDANQPRYYLDILWIFALFAGYGLWMILEFAKSILQRFQFSRNRLSRTIYNSILILLHGSLFLFLLFAYVPMLQATPFFGTQDVLATSVAQRIAAVVPQDAYIIGNYRELIAISSGTELQVMPYVDFLNLPDDSIAAHPFYVSEGLLEFLPSSHDNLDLESKKEVWRTYAFEPIFNITRSEYTFYLFRITGKSDVLADQ